MSVLYFIIICRRAWKIITRRQAEPDETENRQNVSFSIHHRISWSISSCWIVKSRLENTQKKNSGWSGNRMFSGCVRWVIIVRQACVSENTYWIISDRRQKNIVGIVPIVWKNLLSLMSERLRQTWSSVCANPDRDTVWQWSFPHWLERIQRRSEVQGWMNFPFMEDRVNVLSRGWKT